MPLAMGGSSFATAATASASTNSKSFLQGPPEKKEDAPTENEFSLIDLQDVDKMFPVAVTAAIILWLSLLLLVFNMVPPEEYVYLEGPEKEAAAAAVYIFLVSFGLSCVPLYVRKLTGRKIHVSGVLCALIAVQFIALTTNALLAYAPTVVMVDPVTHARVYLVRWCEWIPLAGLLTFLSEIVDCNTGLYGVLVPVLVALSQSISCVMALLLPFCTMLRSWVITMVLSFALWLTIFPRLYHKYKVNKNNKGGVSMRDIEHKCRVKFGYHLLGTCALVWTGLVVLYFINMFAYIYYPDSFYVKNHSLPMILDTLFDVSAKALYMRLIVGVHEAVFDAEGRASRQLDDLKRMISVLWESSSDVIVISVRHASSFSTMISPTFPSMIGAVGKSDTNGEGSALLVKSEELPVRSMHGKDEQGKIRIKSSSFFVDASEIPYYAARNQSVHLPDIQIDDLVTQQADSLVQAAWNGLETARRKGTDKEGGTKKESLVVLDLQKADGSLIKCEIKLSQHSNNAVIAVVRDVTERYLRFDAERRAHAESEARQKDAQTVNRFTRHEIKNGLLAGIELCQEVCNHVKELEARLASLSNDPGNTKCITELDSTLHDVLDTVLAEAMAREIVHESYQPKLERVDLRSALNSGSSIQDEVRCPIHISPKNMPLLSMDPQLLKYIHRNAVSNACKYGKKGGKVTTVIHYFERKGEFVMDVINEPGPWNDVLTSMGDKAAKTVFAQGQRLRVHRTGDDAENQISTGDGAWIMQKCAKTMGGECTIRFEAHETVFTFRCKVNPYTLPWKANAEFQLPPNTWGIGFDDSTIQRKLMKRIFQYAGVDEERIVVKGKDASDVKELDRMLAKILSRDERCNILVLMDENLDYDNAGDTVRMSGSKYSAKALQKLHPTHRDRVFLLVRSANDADSDIALYKQRTHGFFPKATIRKDRVRELLAPAWFERFPDQAVPDMITTVDMSDESDIETEATSTGDTHKFSDSAGKSDCSIEDATKEEIAAATRSLDRVIKKKGDWGVTWSKLHSLKGDLLALEHNDNIELCISFINALRGDDRPKDLEKTWKGLHAAVLKEVQSSRTHKSFRESSTTSRRADVE